MRDPTREIATCIECGTDYIPVRSNQNFCAESCAKRAAYRRRRKAFLAQLASRYRQDSEFRTLSQARAIHRIHTARAGGATDLTAEDILEIRAGASQCALCGCELGETGPARREIDHVVPLAIGGTHTRNNIRVLCCRCNRSRPRDGSDLVSRELGGELQPA